MNKDVCSNFIYLMTNFPDQLDSDGKYKIEDDQHFKQYCSNQNCVNELEKINAGCLYLFDEFFKNSSVFKSVAKSNIDIVEYIIIWLNYMLNLKKNNDGSDSLTYFYTTNINNDKYTNIIGGVDAYSSYKDLIDKTNMMNMDIKDISKFYAPFKLLCEIYNEFDDDNKNCTCLEKANQFVKKYQELDGDSNNTEGTSYNKILSTLSTDYNNLKNKCNDTLSFPSIETAQNTTKITEQTVQNSAQTSEVASLSSSIGNKLIPILSIFGAIAFFLGIGYKYSLFGFRKRSQKRHLREKLKQ
ncbi:BIR protein [Plasmodium berghei]|uniref:BIR protein n=2 Tax=Plasmodium berghei TaxID=5821 RepID=A0A509AJS9_PLABA|nr:BIR protein [Plasmodium berghei ANKA]SBW38311.1 BIR protein [Plasmodium berghei]SCL83516.1 BIR protein [Plasmodium berghei]SCL85844.1 BIR protein [Plasmodium berghei]SCL86225.1 BIR protein [Plasmodium berghei]VUC54026.1 BIR protein [Plasmodium berghei ANKA]|eukprot:XP_034419877.1 BIR protein [Plasmodium berghei ANKA]